jgi:26S proteasome regulatory subunit N9
MYRYTPVNEMDPKLRVRYAQDLCLAALVSDKIYNFGEIVSLPIFNSLQEDKSLSWLSDMLQSFNDGDIDKFNNVFSDRRAEIEKKPALANNIPVLKEKITLLCVMNLIFQRPPSQRNIPFSEIAKATQLDLKQVEWLLIRAMSIGLIRGVIDQVDQTVSVTYIRPRVLDKPQLLSLKNRLLEWSTAVEQSVTFMESNTTELFA